MKRILLSSVVVFAFAAAGHADELSDIQAQAKQLREQNAAMTKRLADLEKRQKALEAKPVVVSAANPVDSMATARAAPAMAADFKAPPKSGDSAFPEVPPLTFGGVTFYGNIDIATQYETHGAPFSGSAYSSPSIIVPQGRQSQFVLAPNQASPSFVGVRVDREIAYETSFVAKAETGFVPTTGALSDALKTLQLSNGIALANQNFSFDAARAGQAFNGQLYAGLSNATFGTLTAGRQYTPLLDEYLRYDPLSSYGFSLFGFSGLASGQGSSETPIMDSSIKYANKIGPVRVSAMYASPETNAKDLLQISGGFDWKGFSIDGVYGRAHDQISAASLAAATLVANPGSNSLLGARVFDSETYGVFGRYRFDLGGGSPDGKFSPNIVVSGAYQHITLMNPADGGVAPGHQTIGGYELGPVIALNGSSASGIVNNAFTGGNRQVDAFFAAVRYQIDPHWAIASGYYRLEQSSFGFGVASPAFSTTPCSSAAFANCRGSEDVASFKVDYQWNRNFTVYAGVTYSVLHDGMRAGFLSADQFSPTLGARFSF